MNQMDYKQVFEMLQKAGFSVPEINRLFKFRRNYRESEMDRPPADRRRLEFARWLVATGRLTEQIA